MLERLVLLVALAAFLAATVLLVRAWLSLRERRLRSSAPEPLWQSLGVQPDGRATLVAFSTPSCAACRTAQAPALQLVASKLGAERLRVVSVDAARQPDVAHAFGILTVPSTVVLAPTGQVLAVNHGFAASDKLAAQLRIA
jgi:thiol-disulfide isomerase/thioredoxin